MTMIEDELDVIDKSDTVKRLKELKILIGSDNDIQDLIASFKRAKKAYEMNEYITEELKTAKEALYNHPVIDEYRHLYAKLDRSFIKFNNHLSSLLKNKVAICHKN
jgi:cell fate (sporulation/competence/biofilm development) regulator YlbF (YheA/YmcA/DUF963 family)